MADCLSNYFGGKTADRELLIRHAEQFDNGAVFKRLGFLADTRLRDKKLADECRARLTQGYAKLDPRYAPSSLSLRGDCGYREDLESRGLMIDKREILEAASSFSLLPNVVEKDYVLGSISLASTRMKSSQKTGSSRAAPVLRSATSRLTVSQRIWILACAMKAISTKNS